MNRRNALAAAALALGLSTQAIADPLKIGLVLPMSGPFGAYGKQIEHGVKPWLAQNGDTIAGRKVEKVGGKLESVEFDNVGEVRDPGKP